MVAHKVSVGVYTLGNHYKDAADFAADNPFDPDLDLDAARELAAELVRRGDARLGGGETRRPDRRRVPS